MFDCINEVYNYVTGNYIRWDEGISSADVLGKLVDKMCGDNAPFNKILILFDEFGRYIEYASDYPNRAGDSALQQIFEVVQDSNNNIVFVGFIQSDLKTYLSRVNKTSNISRYIGRYEAGEKIYLSSNLETIFANLIEVKDSHLHKKYILDNLNKDKSAQENKQLFNKLSQWLPSSKSRGVWNNWDKFENVILNGIYPFSPLSTWMLNYLSDWYQQRSAINFLMGTFETIENKEVTLEKIHKALTVMYEDRSRRFDTFTFRGVKLSKYCNHEWIGQVAKVVENEIYNVDGANNKRAFTNVKLAYDNIKTDFYQRLNNK